MNLVAGYPVRTSASIRFAAETIKRHRQVAAVINFLLLQVLVSVIYCSAGYSIADPIIYVVGFVSIFVGMVIFTVMVDGAKNLVYSAICEMTDDELDQYVEKINHLVTTTGGDFNTEEELQMFWKDHEKARLKI